MPFRFPVPQTPPPRCLPSRSNARLPDWIRSTLVAGPDDPIALDGKTVRGARTDQQAAPHLLSFRTHQSQETLFQVAVSEKTNEIPVAQALLPCLPLAGRVCTADALHTQKEFMRVASTAWEAKAFSPVLATWIIRSKNMAVETEKNSFPCLQPQAGRCRIRRRQQHPHARITLFSCDGEASCMAGVFMYLQRLKIGCWDALSSRFARWTKPLVTSLPLATLTDLGRSKSELIAENALLRKPLIVLRRQVKRPAFTRTDRILLVLLARMVRTWNQALFIVQPETVRRLASGALSLVLEAHVQGCFSYAQGRCRNYRASSGRWRERIAVFGAERIRGELLKLGLQVCKRTIQKYMRGVRTKPPRGQKWSTFLRSHAANIWSCDALSGD
jgi:predicted transposase YbfD/YdcC